MDGVLVCISLLAKILNASRSNRPIVLLRPGNEVRGIPAIRSCKKHRFLYFSEALSLPSMALNDCFFFSLLERHSQCLVMCSSNVGTGKSPDLSDFHPCRSCQSLAIAPASRLDLSCAKATFKRNNLSHARGKMLVWIIKSQTRATMVCLPKKRKRKKCESLGLGNDLRGRQRA